MPRPERRAWDEERVWQSSKALREGRVWHGLDWKKAGMIGESWSGGRDRQRLNNGDWHAMLRSLNFIPDVTIIYWRRDMILDLQIESLSFSYSNSEIQLKKLWYCGNSSPFRNLKQGRWIFEDKDGYKFCCNWSVTQLNTWTNYFHLDSGIYWLDILRKFLKNKYQGFLRLSTFYFTVYKIHPTGIRVKLCECM